MVLKRLFSRKASANVERSWLVPEGERVYAIGDIHGRDDLLAALLSKIETDDAERSPARTTIVFLGDLPDRGPDSRNVILRLMTYQKTRECVFLSGNHEELMIGVWQGERVLTPTFHRAGGRATLASYGVDPAEYDEWDFDRLTEEVPRHVPASHIDFLKSFKDYHCVGDYAFVHAGIRPGLEVEDQDSVDLRWIRGDFIKSDADHGRMIIHGHTITEEIDIKTNRIGIDTGAYASGVLSAIGLEGAERWFLQT